MHPLKSYFPNIFIILFYIGFITNVSYSQKATTQSSLLWKIENKDSKKVSYLFGTIHLIPENKYLFTESMEKAFDASDEVIFEINTAELNDFSKLFGIMNMVRMPDNMVISDLLSPADYDLFKQKFEEMGLPVMMFESFKPLFLSTISGGLMGNEDDKSNDNGAMVSYEFVLTERAQQKGISIAGIESLEEQMSAIDSIPLSVQAEMLMQSLTTENQGDYNLLVDKYLTQDVEALQQDMYDESSGMDSKYMKYLLVDRNIRWIDRMISHMNDKSVFFAVGAGHLGGEQGVINLLRKRGYVLTPVF